MGMASPVNIIAALCAWICCLLIKCVTATGTTGVSRVNSSTLSPPPEAEAEPGYDNDADETTDLPPFGEPVPSWEVALPLYGLFWDIHINILGSLFALLAIYSLVSLIRLRKRRLLSRRYFVALNVMMLVMGLDRAIYLFVDAYTYKNIFPLSVAYLLLGMGFPCLSSAFSILFLALLQSTRTRLVPQRVQSGKVLTGLIVFHFTVSIVVDIVVGVYTSAQALLLLCQGVFLIWGFFLSISYLVIFRRLHRSSMRQFRESTRLSMSRRASSLYGISPFMKKPRNTWGSAIKVTLFASFFGVAIGLLQLYGILVVYGPFGQKVPEPWSWVFYQLVFRTCELSMCILMSYVATQPFRYTASGKEKPTCMACMEICQTIPGHNAHNLNEADDYRLVGSGNFDGSLIYNREPAEQLYEPTESQIGKASVRLPSCNTFHQKNANNSIRMDLKETGGIQLGESLDLDTSPGSEKRVISESTQTSEPLESCLSINSNKNNHHSCPTTPSEGKTQMTAGPQVCHSSLLNLRLRDSQNQAGLDCDDHELSKKSAIETADQKTEHTGFDVNLETNNESPEAESTVERGSSNVQTKPNSMARTDSLVSESTDL